MKKIIEWMKQRKSIKLYNQAMMAGLRIDTQRKWDDFVMHETKKDLWKIIGTVALLILMLGVSIYGAWV